MDFHPAMKPNQPVPALDVPLVGGGRFRLSERRPPLFTMVVFYRGYHCPICKTYLRDLDGRLAEFAQLGVEAAAVTSDAEERAVKTVSEWGLTHLPVGYGLDLEAGRAWGLYVSGAISDKEPARFIEPGLFLVRPDGTLYAGAVQTMPFARPGFGDVLGAVRFIKERNYPARGDA